MSHDHQIFPGMRVANRDVAGVVSLYEGDDVLTILNCNRQPLELTLGVDLIYYNHRFEAFTLVQYKRMSQERGTPTYRPNGDPSLALELERMRVAELLLERALGQDSNPTSFRLSSKPFYFKLCEPKMVVASDPALVTGMYLPLELWSKLLTHASTRGPHGGTAFNWENCTRRFSNSEFAALLRNGWIGSRSAGTQILNRIVEAVLSSGKVLILAGSSRGRQGNDYLRDSWGRFATDDDVEATI